MSERVRLRDASPRDLAFVHAMRREAYLTYVDEYEEGWNEAWQHAHLVMSWRSGQRWILVLDGEDVGYVDLLEDPDSVALNNIIVVPKHQNRGIASDVIGGVLRYAEVADKPVTLTVFRTNPAVALYRRLGFQVEETTAIHLRMQWTPPRA